MAHKKPAGKQQIYHVHEWIPTRGGAKDMCRRCGETREHVRELSDPPQKIRSKEAFVASRPRAETDKGRILKILETEGPLPTWAVTDRLRARFGRQVAKNQIASRVGELVDAGLVVDTGAVTVTDTGNKATVWRLK